MPEAHHVDGAAERQQEGALQEQQAQLLHRLRPRGECRSSRQAIVCRHGQSAIPQGRGDRLLRDEGLVGEPHHAPAASRRGLRAEPELLLDPA